ncbi:succinate dehydrogenase/fumarate reductase iron-sulfur subunit [Corynebacterium kalinowskii]|uniref:Succinate dehydrogenase/fumarate reductase iron-sulfur subunit n=1 Tax=Corynebacterium kalinowskii TaxID=2675216 RepID=A0A6B8VN27_9CORY|nr:(Fe-S)-binding protein [Corynebacterium kalinowskii]QGU01171.1 succinate dehydrogenase/fumarate reductase iron-sulfur subunit [Corynebacterium kalinowskii]
MTSTSIALGIFGILASLPAWVFFLRGAWQLYRMISAGQPTTTRTNQPLTRLMSMLRKVVLHSGMARKPFVALAHWFVMFGFIVGSVFWFEAYIQTFAPAKGWPIVSSWPIYHFAEEVFGLGTVLGILYLIGVRLRVGSNNRFDRFYGSNARAAHFVEAVVLIEGLGMLLVKASSIATFREGSVWADFLTRLIPLPSSPLLVSVFALIKLLSGMVWLFVVGRQLRWGVAWHRFLAFFTLFFSRKPGEKSLGELAPMMSNGKALTLENADPDVDKLGVGTLADAPWKMLLDVSACTDCGRCQEQCPAWNTEKPLSPKLLVTGIRDAIPHQDLDVLKLVGSAVDPDALWSCTNCGACVEQCPVDIEHLDHVTNLRRFQVLAEADFPSELTGMFKNLEVKGNPWGRNASEQLSWVEEANRDGIPVPLVSSGEEFEYLLWVGCAGAFDENGRKTSRAIAELLNVAGVKFAVLEGTACTGDPARRAGNEFLFQMLADENVSGLNSAFETYPAGQRKIITSCAHCFNTLRNEYPAFGGDYDVIHHTQLLNRLVRKGLLTPVPRRPEDRKPITYHDPCFLGRHNKVFDPPRELIESVGTLTEMPRNRDTGFCCGAGGARMFIEENLGTRINENRATEALSVSNTVATSCPFCTTMLEGGVKAVSGAGSASVRDIAVMLRDAVLVDDALPEFRTPAFLEEPRRVAASPVDDADDAKNPPSERQNPPKTVESTGEISAHPLATPPIAGPPVATPPVATPPVVAPPVAGPPTAVPPVAGPPTAVPPVATPPVATPPVATPPAATPPVATPPAATPPVAAPPAAGPPTAVPPVATPPVATPPTTTRPTAAPPSAQPPVAAPPVAKPPAATPPTAQPPTAQPPTAQPPGAK